ncbi:MAG TPA: GtrA family protein [Burkholderiales bacterium]|jgi:putative flippase GtrA
MIATMPSFSNIKLLRFGALAGSTWLADMLGFWLLVQAGLAPSFANMISAGLVALLVYALSVRHVFREHRGSYAMKIALYLGYQVVAISFFSWLISLLVQRGWPPLWAKVGVTPLSFYAHFQVMSLLLTHRMRWV